MTAETAPHYVSLTDRELLRGDADYRMNPPLRTQADVDEIINGLCDGTLDAIATDHAPHTPEEKADFVKAPNGSIGMETSFAVCNSYLVKTGRMTLSQLVEKMSVNPARILKINAGTLSVGANADVVLINPDEEWTVDAGKLHGKSKNTPFKGRTLTGKVKKTILGGKVVFEDTAVITATGTGYVYGVSTYFDGSSVTEDSSIDFQKGVYINAAGGTAISAAGNSDTSAEGIVTINQGSAAGANEVVIFGDIESDIKGVVNVNLNTAGSVFNGSTSLYDDGVIKLAVTDGAAWRLTGTSSVTDLKAAAGGKIDLSGDRGTFSTLAIQKLTGTGGSFIVDNDGTDSDKITVAASDKGIHGITINNISSLVGKELKPENTFITVTGDADFVGETTYGGGISVSYTHLTLPTILLV